MSSHVPDGIIILGNVGGRVVMTTYPSVDPSIAPGVDAPVGSLYLQDDGSVGNLWVKTGAAQTAWSQLATSTTVSPISDGIYGDGDDGNVTDAGNRTLDRVYQYNNWTVNAGATITPARFPVFVKGTLTLAGSILEDGAAGVGQATGGTGGGAGAAGYLGFGSLGGNGGGSGSGGANGAATNAQPRGIGTRGAGGAGGLSGAGGASGAGGVLTLGATNLGAPYSANSNLGFFCNSPGANPIAGGSGGGGGGGGSAVGGKGGGGGGVVVIIAKAIEVTGAGLIAARGGAGATGVSGNGGGGGGGGGGKVLIITRSYTGTAPSVAGGAGGAGQGTGNPGVAGNAGQLVILSM